MTLCSNQPEITLPLRFVLHLPHTALFHRPAYIRKGVAKPLERVCHTAAVFLRTYLNLGDSKRFGLFNEARVSYGYSESNSSSGTGIDLSGMYQLKHNLNIGVAPGLTVFINDYVAAEASVSVAGLNFNWYDQTKDQVYKGKRTASSANFKINLLSIDLGIVFYL